MYKSMDAARQREPEATEEEHQFKQVERHDKEVKQKMEKASPERYNDNNYDHTGNNDEADDPSEHNDNNDDNNDRNKMSNERHQRDKDKDNANWNGTLGAINNMQCERPGKRPQPPLDKGNQQQHNSKRRQPPPASDHKRLDEARRLPGSTKSN